MGNKKEKTLTEKVVETLDIWRKDPVLGVRQLFSVEPTEQQIKLIKSAWSRQARVAVSSCQGAGKTSTLVWLTYLFLLTQEDCRVLITSPSYSQLSRVFAAESLKWLSKMPQVFQDFFIIQKDLIYIKNRRHIFAALVTASADNRESLQGGHSESYVILADEASGINEDVFDLLLGTLSTGKGGRFILASNPLRSVGRFAEIFSRSNMGKEDGGTWDRIFFSAYESPNINKDWIEEMKNTYGEDSDIFRVRVLGQFPRVTTTQFIASDVVDEAIKRLVTPQVYSHFPKIIGVDVARFGDDKTVFALRQGPKVLDIKLYSKLNTMEVVSKLYEYQTMVRSQAIYVDSTGVGAGVEDRAKELLGKEIVHGVIAKTQATNPLQYANLRSQLIGTLKDWLENGADIPEDEDLKNQLLSLYYGYTNKMQIQLVGKKELKKMGLASPDMVDALSYTFVPDVYSTFTINTKPREIIRSRTLWV